MPRAKARQLSACNGLSETGQRSRSAGVAGESSESSLLTDHRSSVRDGLEFSQSLEIETRKK